MLLISEILSLWNCLEPKTDIAGKLLVYSLSSFVMFFLKAKILSWRRRWNVSSGEGCSAQLLFCPDIVNVMSGGSWQSCEFSDDVEWKPKLG